MGTTHWNWDAGRHRIHLRNLRMKYQEPEGRSDISFWVGQDTMAAERLKAVRLSLWHGHLGKMLPCSMDK